MPTCRDIISAALKLGKVIGVNASPTASEAAFGMDALQSFYLDLAAGGMFGQLADSVVSAAYVARPGQRLRVLSGGSVTYPTELAEGGSVFPPYDLSLVEAFDVTAGTRSLKLFEAGRGEWVELVGLTLDDEAPLATRGMMGLAGCLATYGAFVAAFSPTLDGTIQPLVRSFRAAMIGKAGGDRPNYADSFA